jgi:RHS repeat-associated protein
VGDNGSITYAYDPAGNRLARTSTVGPVPSAIHAYDANDRLASDAYDDNGNTTGSGGTTFAYDFENRITSVNGGLVVFVYDGDGNRVAKTVDGVTTFYLVDDRSPTGYAQVVEEIVGGSATRAYTYGRELLGQRTAAGTMRFYHYDGQGSVRLLTDASASPTDTYDYDAFGNSVRAVGGTMNSYLFRGEQFDSSTNSYYLRARYYRPSLGRFLTEDSWSGNTLAPPTLHRYVYVVNNPVTRADPSGHFGLAEIGAVSGISSILAQVPSVTPNPPGIKFEGSLRASIQLGAGAWKSEAVTQAAAAVNELDAHSFSGARFRKWFADPALVIEDVDLKDHWTYVKDGVARIDAALSDSRGITYVPTDVQDAKCKKPLPGGAATVAYTNKGKNDLKISLCKAFFDPNRADLAIQGAVVIHELSHNVYSTVDLVYGKTGAIGLASTPRNARINADNYFHFSYDSAGHDLAILSP